MYKLNKIFVNMETLCIRKNIKDIYFEQFFFLFSRAPLSHQRTLKRQRY